MRFLLRTTLALGLAAITDSPMASESLAKTKGCLNCHGIDVAKKYAGQEVNSALSFTA